MWPRGEAPILSILVPTYNRASHLDKLLQELKLQLLGCPEGSVEVVISDNCSSDETSQICSQIFKLNGPLRYIRQAHNIGPDSNFLALIKEVRGSYFWLFGDDDLPRRGLLSLLVQVLQSKSPALLYLPSTWRPHICSSDLDPISSLKLEADNPIAYAQKHHIWTTFISAWIVSRAALDDRGITLEVVSQGIGSYFVQLGWILPLLKNKRNNFYSITDICILATSSNQRGGHFLRTFCINYPDAVVRLTGDNKLLSRSLVSPFLASYLPSLILSIRTSRLGDQVDVWPQLLPVIKRLWSYPRFWIFCLPVLLIPTPLIHFLYCQVKRIRSLARCAKLQHGHSI